MGPTTRIVTTTAYCLAVMLSASAVWAQERDIFDTARADDEPATTDSATPTSDIVPTEPLAPSQQLDEPAAQEDSSSAEVATATNAPKEPVVDSIEVGAYRSAIAAIESTSGAYAAELPEQLLSLGLGLQQQGRHEEAILVFKRGTHLARINDGLHSAVQIPLVQGEIYSHMAANQFEEADERQSYLYSVQVRSMSGGTGRTAALMQQAVWQYNAYRLGVGENPFMRLLNMWDLYRLALTEIIEREGETSSELLPPLNGMLRSQFLISSFNPESRGGRWSDDQNFSGGGDSRFQAYRVQSYKKGQAVIRAIYEIEKTNSGDKSMTAIESLVLLGDWKLWHGERDGAMEAYNDALGELAQRDAAQADTQRLFGVPVALPNIEGIRPLPPEVEHEQADILLEFNVTERGRVTDVARLKDADEESSKVANRLVRTLRQTRFRPRFVDGEPQATEKVIKAYEIHQQPG